MSSPAARRNVWQPGQAETLDWDAELDQELAEMDISSLDNELTDADLLTLNSEMAAMDTSAALHQPIVPVAEAAELPLVADEPQNDEEDEEKSDSGEEGMSGLAAAAWLGANIGDDYDAYFAGLGIANDVESKKMAGDIMNMITVKCAVAIDKARQLPTTVMTTLILFRRRLVTEGAPAAAGVADTRPESADAAIVKCIVDLYPAESFNVQGLLDFYSFYRIAIARGSPGYTSVGAAVTEINRVRGARTNEQVTADVNAAVKSAVKILGDAIMVEAATVLNATPSRIPVENYSIYKNTIRQLAGTVLDMVIRAITTTDADLKRLSDKMTKNEDKFINDYMTDIFSRCDDGRNMATSSPPDGSGDVVYNSLGTIGLPLWRLFNILPSSFCYNLDQLILTTSPAKNITADELQSFWFVLHDELQIAPKMRFILEQFGEVNGALETILNGMILRDIRNGCFEYIKTEASGKLMDFDYVRNALDFRTGTACMWVEDSKLKAIISAAESALDAAHVRPDTSATDADHDAAIDKYIPIADTARTAMEALTNAVDTDFNTQWTLKVDVKRQEREAAFTDAQTKMTAVVDFVATKDAVIAILTNEFNPVNVIDYSTETNTGTLGAAKATLDGLILKIATAKQQLVDNRAEVVTAFNVVADIDSFPYAVATASDVNERILTGMVEFVTPYLYVIDSTEKITDPLAKTAAEAKRATLDTEFFGTTLGLYDALQKKIALESGKLFDAMETFEGGITLPTQVDIDAQDAPAAVFDGELDVLRTAVDAKLGPLGMRIMVVDSTTAVNFACSADANFVTNTIEIVDQTAHLHDADMSIDDLIVACEYLDEFVQTLESETNTLPPYVGERLKALIELVKAMSAQIVSTNDSVNDQLEEVREWGKKFQKIAIHQYGLNQKVREFYGDFYDFNAPKDKEKFSAEEEP